MPGSSGPSYCTETVGGPLTLGIASEFQTSSPKALKSGRRLARHTRDYPAAGLPTGSFRFSLWKASCNPYAKGLEFGRDDNWVLGPA